MMSLKTREQLRGEVKTAGSISFTVRVTDGEKIENGGPTVVDYII
jgi:hypothetical protein